MQAARPPILRGILLLAALAAIAFIMARGDSPAAAYTPHPLSYDPQNVVSVSDPSPGAAADIKITFSVDAPDSFPNVKTNSSIQFIPRQWDIHVPETQEEMLARVGGIAGSFNALTTLGILGSLPCSFPIPVPFTLLDASTDTSVTTSALDIGGGVHPGGPGYSGQFAADPATVQPPGDLGLPLRAFNANEKADRAMSLFWAENTIYRDVDNSGTVSVGDIRLTEGRGYGAPWGPAGSVVQPGDGDVTGLLPHVLNAITGNYKHDNADGNLQMDAGENIYRDANQPWLNKVSYGDVRLFFFGQLDYLSIVQLFQLPGGITHYPDFLNQMIDPAVVGDPLARMFGAYNVLGITAVSLNIVTYRPGQLPGYPATLGYPNIVILLNPVAPIETYQINQTSDMCTPLSLTSTNLGVSKDNPATLANEAGYVRLTNPKSEKSHDFTLITTSMPDADDDGIENMLDACAFDPNVNDNSRGDFLGSLQSAYDDPDQDGLDAACDPWEEAPPDFDRDLIPFNPDEKAYQGEWCMQCYSNPAIYRDLTAPFNKVSAGDIRLWDSQSRPIGVPVVAGDTDIGRSMGTIGSSPGPYRHADDGAVAGQYDAGEDIYIDMDDSNDVSLFDQRFLINGERLGYWDPDVNVMYLGQSPTAPGTYVYDEDQDNYGNRADNCPLVPNGIEVLGVAYQQVPGFTFNWGITGDLIGSSDQLDSDGDDIGDACDPDPGAITGEMQVRTLTQGVPIFKHGIKLNNLGGPKNVNSGARTYSVDVSNLGSSAEDVRVGLRVVEGCAVVSGPSSVSVPADGSASASFTVDFTGCAAGTYTVQADACHAGDAAPAGLFGSGACPGTSDGMTDPNPLDDAPIAKSVEVGTP